MQHATTRMEGQLWSWLHPPCATRTAKVSQQFASGPICLLACCVLTLAGSSRRITWNARYLFRCQFNFAADCVPAAGISPVGFSPGSPSRNCASEHEKSKNRRLRWARRLALPHLPIMYSSTLFTFPYNMHTLLFCALRVPTPWRRRKRCHLFSFSSAIKGAR